MTDTDTYHDTDTSDLNKKSTDQLRREVRQLQKENNSLSRRLLGVNELARLLQEKSENCETLQDRNQRLELALVRLENRCSNFEKKLMSQQFSSLPSDVNTSPSSISSNRTGGGSQQSPFIPGPSRQILEQLMKDNTDLRNTINGLTKKGPKGFMEAVKMNHLEEVIDQKNEKIALLQKQITTLTASPTDDEGTSSGTLDPGTLKRQLLKMEQSMKVKDRFCTLLSERIDHLQKQVHQGTDLPDGPDPGRNMQEGMEPDIKERNSRKIIEQLQKQVEEERAEKKEFISKLEESDRKVSEFEKKNVNLQQKLDNFSAYTDTLMSEKKDMEKQMERLSGQYHPSTQVADMEKTITKLKETHRQDLSSKNKEIDNLKTLLDDARMKFAMAESMRTPPEQLKGLQETIKDLEEDKLSLESEKGQLLETIKNLQIGKQKSQYTTHGAGHMTITGGYRTGGAPIQPMPDFRGRDCVVDHAKTKPTDPTLSHHCGSNILDTPIRPEVPPINHKPRCATDDSKEDVNTTSTTSYSQSPTNKSLTLAISGGVRPSYQTNNNPPSTPHGRVNTAPMSPNAVDPTYYQQGGVYQSGETPSYPTHTYRTGPQQQQQQVPVPDRVSSSLGGGASPSPITRSQSPYTATSIYQSVVTPGPQGTYSTVYNRGQPSSTHQHSGPLSGQSYGQPTNPAAYGLTPQYNQSSDTTYPQRHSGEVSYSYNAPSGQFTVPSGQLFGSNQQQPPTTYNYPSHFFTPNTGTNYNGNPAQYGYSSNAPGPQQGAQGSQPHRRNSPPASNRNYDARN